MISSIFTFKQFYLIKFGYILPLSPHIICCLECTGDSEVLFPNVMHERTDFLMGGPGRIQQALESSSVVVVNHSYNLETGETLSVSKNLSWRTTKPKSFWRTDAQVRKAT